MQESFTLIAGRSVEAAHTRRGELACIPKTKVEICRQRKGHTVCLHWYDNDFSKCKQNLSARYRAPSALLAFKFCRTLHWR